MADDQLEPLITECPNCSTRFRVTEAQLEVASGRVRCGACLTVFQGTEHLLWEAGAGFDSAKQAAAALDELLSELRDDGPGTKSAAADAAGLATDASGLVDLKSLGTDPPGSDYPRSDLNAAQGWEDEERQLYVGHEEDLPVEPETDETDSSDADAADASDLSADADSMADTAVDVEEASAEASAEVAGEDSPWIAEEPESGTPPDTTIPLTDQPDSESERSPEAAAEEVLLTPPAVDPLGLEPEPAQQITFAREPRRWWVAGAMLLALLALAGQVFWYQFESWGRDPTLRPLYAGLCDLFGCELPVLRDLDALRTDKLLVRSHPEFANALIVDTVIVNEAPFAQPFPALDLRFTTIDGTMVAGRLFQPEEYLAGELAGAKMMPPNTPIRLELELQDPGGDAVSYFLSFR